MGTRLVQVPIVSDLSHKELGSLPGATCDDPVYKASPASPRGWPGGSKPCSWDGFEAPQDELEEQGGSSTDSISEDAETSGSSSHSSTGFGKGAKLDPDKSVVLTMENMSQMALRVCHILYHFCCSLTALPLARAPQLHLASWVQIQAPS